MNLEELEEALQDILPAGFKIEKGKRGQLIVFTNLLQDEDGELVDFESDEDDDDELDFDGNIESLDIEDDDD